MKPLLLAGLIFGLINPLRAETYMDIHKQCLKWNNYSNCMEHRLRSRPIQLGVTPYKEVKGSNIRKSRHSFISPLDMD